VCIHKVFGTPRGDGSNYQSEFNFYLFNLRFAPATHPVPMLLPLLLLERRHDEVRREEEEDPMSV
jgi:hypothetical protein